MSIIYINTDGGSRGNPGPAGIGLVFFNEQQEELHSCYKYIGETTNNQAEYAAIIKALEILLRSKWLNKNSKDKSNRIICRLDSKLVVEQINGNYKVKNAGIKPLIEKINILKDNIKLPISFVYIPREKNKRADQLANNAMDEGHK